MTKLKELEQRLRDEPDNLGLRVVVAGALHEAGRRADAVELYRSVAVAYRDQGRPQQAITVCRSILELAPEDAPCHELLAALLASAPAPRASPMPAPASRSSPSPLPGARPSPLPPSHASWVERPSPSPLPRPSEPEGLGEPLRRSSGEMTPLPSPLAHHDADPTGSLRRLTPADLPPTLREELAAFPEIAGIAAAARQISASLIAANRLEQTAELDDDDLAAELDTGRLMRTGAPRLSPSASVPPPVRRPPTSPPVPPPPPVRRSPSPSSIAPPSTATSAQLAATGERTLHDEDEPTLAPFDAVTCTVTVDDERTEPRELPIGIQPPIGELGSGGAAAAVGSLDEATSPRLAAAAVSPALRSATPAARSIGEAGRAAKLPSIGDAGAQGEVQAPGRGRSPAGSTAPPTAATGPLAGAFFAPLPPRNRAAVLQRCRRRIVAPGTVVIRRGEADHGLVIVVRGRLELHSQGDGDTLIALGAVEPGEFAGEASLLAGAPSAVHVIAATDAELLVLAADDFHDVARSFPALRAELEAAAARRPR